jgi:hypothetical protein
MCTATLRDVATCRLPQVVRRHSLPTGKVQDRYGRYLKTGTQVCFARQNRNLVLEGLHRASHGFGGPVRGAFFFASSQGVVTAIDPAKKLVFVSQRGGHQPMIMGRAVEMVRCFLLWLLFCASTCPGSYFDPASCSAAFD